MIESEFIVKPDEVDYTINNIVSQIDKGYKLQEFECDLSGEERLNYSDSIILKPDYQRDYRSTLEDESSLIESILVGIPIPPVFLSSTRVNGAQALNVVDGQHRLYAFYRYRKGEFALTNLELLDKYNHFKFSDLPPELQEKIVTHKISTYVFRDFPGKKFELEIFNRYNKGTKTLTPQEIRNAVYSSVHNEFVSKFVTELYENKENPLTEVYNVTKDRYLKKKVHEGIFTILYVLENGINVDFKDSTTYANEYMRTKAELIDTCTDDQIQADLENTKQLFQGFNDWILTFTSVTPYPFSKELYGISSRNFKFQTSMALILPAIYRKVFIDPCMEIGEDELLKMIQSTMLHSFIEDPNYTASSTNSKEIIKLVDSFGN